MCISLRRARRASTARLTSRLSSMLRKRREVLPHLTTSMSERRQSPGVTCPRLSSSYARLRPRPTCPLRLLRLLPCPALLGLVERPRGPLEVGVLLHEGLEGHVTVVERSGEVHIHLGATVLTGLGLLPEVGPSIDPIGQLLRVPVGLDILGPVARSRGRDLGRPRVADLESRLPHL